MSEYLARAFLGVISVSVSIASGSVLLFSSAAKAAPEGVMLAAVPTAPLPGAELLGVGGIVIGVGTAVAGVLIPLAQKYNERQQAKFDHEFRLRRHDDYVVRLESWAAEAQGWIEATRKKVGSSVVLPTSPGLPPKPDPSTIEPGSKV